MLETSLYVRIRPEQQLRGYICLLANNKDGRCYLDYEFDSFYALLITLCAGMMRCPESYGYKPTMGCGLTVTALYKWGEKTNNEISIGVELIVFI